ncbi:MAG TPA: A24 family peptidase [Sphingobium sp.]|uniref:prepilin peptidase n=1 Tax=Sphingobium sp. TaxID=1912891 RepID=UPI002ED16325
MNPALFWVGGGALLGLIIGSFLGALVMRWPREESVLRGRSHCDHCDRTLGVRDLVPVLSALASRLRCRSCGARIDPVHLLMELGAAIIGAAAFGLATGPLAALGWCLLGWIVLALALLDARHFWLPDALTLPLAFLGLTIGPFVTDASMPDRWIGAAVGYGALMAIALGYRALRGREGLGLGDAKLLGAIGAWTGWQALPFVLLIASVAALGWAGVMALRGQAVDGASRLPLGTFLCLAMGPAMLVEAMLLIG